MFDKVIIVDQSISNDVETTFDIGNPTAFVPIFSKKGFGRDSVVKLFPGFTHANLVNKYGTPNMNTYLAPMYYAYEFLRGGGNVYTRRIVSSTSTLAHAIIVAKGKAVTTKYEVEFDIMTVADATSYEATVAAAEALLDVTPEVGEPSVYPIAIVSLLWSGSEGNKYTFRLLQDFALEKQIEQRGYQVAIAPNAATDPTVVEFSSNDGAMLDGVSIYANDYFETAYPDAKFEFLTGYNAFLAAIATYIPTDEEYPDIFFGINKDTRVAYPNYTIKETSTDFTAIGGIALANGSDGSFATSVSTRVDNMMTELTASFLEEDSLILTNEYKYHVDFLFDFGTPTTVKTAIAGFVNSRQTTTAIMDVGTVATTGKSAILTARLTGDATWNNMNITVVSGAAGYVDPFTTKKVLMPASFFEAYAIPNHILTQDRGSYPFAGDRYPYANMIAGSYAPRFYSENDTDLEAFKDNRINVAFEDSKGYVPYIQSTSLKVNSDLAERNNVYLLHKLIRIGLLTAKAERWNFAEDEDINKYEDTLNKNAGFLMDGLFGSLELTAAREGTIGESKNRVLVTVTIRFKYINKGTTFKFIVTGADTTAAVA